MGRHARVTDDEIVSALAQVGPMQAGELSARLGLHRNTLLYRMERLIGDGRVDPLGYVGEKSKVRYAIASESFSIESIAEGSTGLWGLPRDTSAQTLAEQLIEIADAAWEWNAIDFDHSGDADLFDGVCDRLHRALLQYRPHCAAPQLLWRVSSHSR